MKNSSTDSSEGRALRRYNWVLLGGTIAVLCLAEWMLRAFVVPVIDSRANRVDQVYRASNPDAVLGDSHLYRGFLRSERFENLARPGSSPEALEIVAREYYRRLAPGRVIVQASPQLFNPVMLHEGTQLHDGWFSLNLGLPFVPYLFEPGIGRELAAFRDPGNLQHKARVALGRLVVDGAFVTRIAASRRKLSDEDRREQAETRVRQNRPSRDFESTAPFQSYARLVDFLLERGARVCLAATPVDDAYQEAALEEPGHQQVDRALRALAAERGVPYVDFRDLALSLDVADFTNPDHLTTGAGIRYAERLEAACFSDRR